MPEITKWGFGMAPIKPEIQWKNCKAINQVKNFVLSKESVDGIIDNISFVKGIYNRIIKQDQWDWFTIYMYMDYPDSLDVKDIVCALANLRRAIIQNNNSLVEKSRKKLELSNFILYCNNYLTFNIHMKTRKEYLYILSRREEKDILKIGMTTRNVQKRVNEINSATGILYPYSARKVYKVKDCQKVEKEIHFLLADYRIRMDREFFKIPYKDACTLIEEYLAESCLGFYTRNS